jgi:uncharacterized protein YjbI with pentapeptide repeats
MADFRFSSKTTKQLGLAISVVVAPFLIYGLIWELPHHQANQMKSKEKFDAEQAARVGWIQGLGAVFAAGTAVITWKTYQENQRNAERNFQALREKQDRDAAHSEKNLQVLLEKNTADRFSGAVEMLGDKEQITVRLGGIYSLERIAKDSPEDYHWIIMELLTAFIRENSHFPFCANLEQLAEAMKTYSKPVGKDIQAILTVLGRRENRKFESSSLNLTKTCLCGASFGDADLTGIDFCYTDLSRSHFLNANLTGVVFRYANLEDIAVPASEKYKTISKTLAEQDFLAPHPA